jgi:hypothetical protein
MLAHLTFQQLTKERKRRQAAASSRFASSGGSHSGKNGCNVMGSAMSTSILLLKQNKKLRIGTSCVPNLTNLLAGRRQQPLRLIRRLALGEKWLQRHGISNE